MTEQPAAIHTEHLTRRYGKFIAVDDLNLDVQPGTIYGFIGPNGAGKTTTLRMLAGLLEPTSGTVYLQGHSLHRNMQAAQHFIGYMPDFFGVYDDLRVWEYLDFFARCHGIERHKRRTTVEGLLDLVDLADKREAFVQHLSRGMQQRLCLAHALVHDPPILLLDEPASGLDPQARVELRELLRTLRDMGKTIILSSHILTELEDICTEVGIIARGKLLASGPLETLRRTGRRQLTIDLLADHQQAMLLIASMEGVRRIQPLVAGDRSLHIDFDGDDTQAAALLTMLTAHGLPVVDFHRQNDNLERLFLRLVNGEPLVEEEVQ